MDMLTVLSFSVLAFVSGCGIVMYAVSAVKDLMSSYHLSHKRSHHFA